MKKLTLALFLMTLLLGVSSCSSSNATVSKINTPKKFQFSHAKLLLSQLIKPKIAYHTEDELEKIFNNRLMTLMKENNLLSNDTNVDKLVINAKYQRRFFADETPLATDSLAYPRYSYTIEIMNKDKSLHTISKDDLTFNGGLAMNLQVIAGALRDKKYEIEFVEVLANTIIEEIKNL